MGRPKITVITAVYNGAETIEQTIQSVIEQDYDNFEYIVIDGKSTDGTTDILEKYGNKISYWISEPDQGVYDAFNKGVKLATGDYIQFLGADDCLCDKKVLSAIAEELTDDIDILSAGVWFVDEKYSTQQYVGNSSARDKSKFLGGMIPHTGIFAKRTLLTSRPFDISYRIAADYLFFLSCYYDENVKFKFLDLPVAFFSSQGISSTNNVQLLAENERIWQKYNIASMEFSDSKIKEIIKRILKKIGVFEIIRYVVNRYISKKVIPHKCNWAQCRWCNRNNL